MIPDDYVSLVPFLLPIAELIQFVPIVSFPHFPA